ncbi:MAG: hypothetical protein RLZZ118_1802, partial [Bacteroidota bacterium]
LSFNNSPLPVSNNLYSIPGFSFLKLALFLQDKVDKIAAAKILNDKDVLMIVFKFLCCVYIK